MEKTRHRLQRKAGAYAQSHGPRTRQLYLRWMSAAFRREERAVGLGITAFHEAGTDGRDLYSIRRNVHMIEKGLTMRPRRSEFALDYIERTVSLVERSTESGVLDSSADELAWVLAVLAEYFEATKASASAVIEGARTRFEVIAARIGVEPDRGPHLAAPPESRVEIADLQALAHGRRSVRWFRDERVPRVAVDAAVTVAAESPTACNRQPYRFEIFDDPESVARVASIPMGTRGYAEQIPGIVVVVGDYSAFFDERDRHLIYIDGCLASMGFVLGMEAQGIGTCCINWPDITAREVAMRELLGLAEHEKVIMLIAYGYADPTGLVPASLKKPLDHARRFRTL